VYPRATSNSAMFLFRVNSNHHIMAWGCCSIGWALVGHTWQPFNMALLISTVKFEMFVWKSCGDMNLTCQLFSPSSMFHTTSSVLPAALLVLSSIPPSSHKVLLRKKMNLVVYFLFNKQVTTWSVFSPFFVLVHQLFNYPNWLIQI
jgi:hypothetical protein